MKRLLTIAAIVFALCVTQAQAQGISCIVHADCAFRITYPGPPQVTGDYVMVDFFGGCPMWQNVHYKVFAKRMEDTTYTEVASGTLYPGYGYYYGMSGFNARSDGQQIPISWQQGYDVRVEVETETVGNFGTDQAPIL